MRYKYLVSVFVNDKNVNSYFSVNLDDLMTIKAIHKDCEIHIFDLEDYSYLSKEQVEHEVQKSGQRWKKSLEKREEEPIVAKPVVVKAKKERRKKCWERPVLCVETGQIYKSIRECSEHTGIPYMTITNCIKNKNATRGVHFVNATLPNTQEE